MRAHVEQRKFIDISLHFHVKSEEGIYLRACNGSRFHCCLSQVLFVISDANLGPDAESALAASKSLRKSGVLVNTIGVTMEMSLMYSVEIATSDYYVWPGFDNELYAILDELQKQPGGINHSSQTVGCSKL